MLNLVTRAMPWSVVGVLILGAGRAVAAGDDAADGRTTTAEVAETLPAGTETPAELRKPAQRNTLPVATGPACDIGLEFEYLFRRSRLERDLMHEARYPWHRGPERNE